MDGLRAVAIGLVFLTHYVLLPYGYLGVSVFFVLSGFLITRVLLNAREQPHRFSTFYIKRSLRIFPPYVLVWGVIALLTPVLHVAWNRANWLYPVYLGNSIWTIWGNQPVLPPGYIHVGFGGLTSSGLARHFLLVGHFWTLCVEEQFYLVWPMVVFWTRQTRRLLHVCLGLIVCVTLLKLPMLFAAGFPNTVTRVTVFRADEFAWGGALAILIHLGRAGWLFRRANWLFAGAAALLALALAVDAHLSARWSEQRWDFVANTLAADVASVTILLLCMMQNSWLAHLLSRRPLVRLGRISYGFYIFHDIPHSLLREWLHAVPVAFGWLAVAAAGFALALALAALSYRFVEQPFLRMKDRPTPDRLIPSAATP
jgi:peptidoglycan/LPS O-acetylase OafA/YrhL